VKGRGGGGGEGPEGGGRSGRSLTCELSQPVHPAPPPSTVEHPGAGKAQGRVQQAVARVGTSCRTGKTTQQHSCQLIPCAYLRAEGFSVNYRGRNPHRLATQNSAE
jgi:hypothetical protein